MLEEKLKYQDLLALLGEAKDKVKTAGLRCDTMHMSPKVYDLIIAELKKLSGLGKTPISNIMLLGLKLIKHKHMPENTVIFSHLGNVRRIEDWALRGLNNGTQKNKEKESA